MLAEGNQLMPAAANARWWTTNRWPAQFHVPSNA
jgi:hypothetical protein